MAIVYFSMVLQTPRFTLFPYTTLFRSPSSPGAESNGPAHRRAAAPCPASGLPPSDCPRHAAPARDRKSTRLNSSHVRISYAVFCLKKKTISRQDLQFILRELTTSNCYY